MLWHIVCYRVGMTIIAITPCLLGFDVKITENNNTRAIGVFPYFGTVIELLLRNWKLEFTIVLR